jgi:hypothetical protein
MNNRIARNKANNEYNYAVQTMNDAIKRVNAGTLDAGWLLIYANRVHETQAALEATA